MLLSICSSCLSYHTEGTNITIFGQNEVNEINGRYPRGLLVKVHNVRKCLSYLVDFLYCYEEKLFFRLFFHCTNRAKYLRTCPSNEGESTFTTQRLGFNEICCRPHRDPGGIEIFFFFPFIDSLIFFCRFLSNISRFDFIKVKKNISELSVYRMY